MTSRILFAPAAVAVCLSLPVLACEPPPPPGTPSTMLVKASAEYRLADAVFVGKVVNISRVAQANTPTLKATIEPARVFKGKPLGVLEYTYPENAEACPENKVNPVKVGTQSMYFMRRSGKADTTARLMLPLGGRTLAEATLTAKLVDTMATLSRGK
ncbi:hypothetical protein [Massilia glaciei]|uniref:Uncharacterized protein n=1 Tax=Massilia glaciei TaxID=1524097 RepID=A0A2U2I747_9BURK|nr:hypothetical protein [Massilia glaciei]PWF55573.1 hypothetical protein C7C56_001245 [Massilia glaciei]